MPSIGVESSFDPLVITTTTHNRAIGILPGFTSFYPVITYNTNRRFGILRAAGGLPLY